MLTPVPPRPEPPSEFLIVREFEAPRVRVFDAWTNARSLAQWWGPRGLTLEVLGFDLRPGGFFHYGMKAPSANPLVGQMFGRFEFRDLEAPERLVFINGFADSHGNLVRHPLSPTWPLRVLNTLTLSEDDHVTTLRLHGVPMEADEFEVETFRASQPLMHQGFAGTLDQLEAFLRLGS